MFQVAMSCGVAGTRSLAGGRSAVFLECISPPHPLLLDRACHDQLPAISLNVAISFDVVSFLTWMRWWPMPFKMPLHTICIMLIICSNKIRVATAAATKVTVERCWLLVGVGRHRV